MSKITEFLKEIGTDAATIQALEGDTADVSELALSYTKKRKDLFLNDSETLTELKQKFNAEQYPVIAKSFNAEIKRLTGMTAEEVDALSENGQIPNPKKVLQIALEKVKTTSAGGVDEVKEKLFKVQAEKDELAGRFTSQIEELKGSFDRERKSAAINDKFNKIVAGMELIVPHEPVSKMLASELMAKYVFDIGENGLEAKNLDGTRASNGKDFLSAEDLVRMKVEEYKLLKLSNGGGNPPPIINGNPPPTNGKPTELTGRAKEMAERAIKNNQ